MSGNDALFKRSTNTMALISSVSLHLISQPHFLFSYYYLSLYNWTSLCSSKHIIGYPAGWCERMCRFAGNSSFCQGNAFEVLTPFSTHGQFIICMFYLLTFHTKQDFVFKNHILPFYIHCYGIFKLWEYYRLCPSAESKQSIHFVSFLDGRTHSHPFAGHTTNYISVSGCLCKSDMQELYNYFLNW